MSISATTVRWFYNGDGGTAQFAYDNRIFNENDLDVYVDGSLQTITTHYTVSGVGQELGGTVTFLVAPGSGTANVWIESDIPDTQATEFPIAGPFPAKAVEDAFDRLTRMLQQGLAAPLSTFTVATVPEVDPAGRLVYVTDETGGAVPAFSDGTDWRRVTDRAVVS